MERVEEDSFDELGAIMKAIKQTELLEVVHKKVANTHRFEMEKAERSAAEAHQDNKTHRRLYRV